MTVYLDKWAIESDREQPDCTEELTTTCLVIEPGS